MQNDLFIITKNLFDTIPDKSKLSKVATLHGPNSRRGFFTGNFNNVRCTLSRDEVASMGIGSMRNSNSFAFVTKVNRVEKNDTICYRLDDRTIDVWVAKDSFLFNIEQAANLPISEFRDALNALCEDIDNNIITYSYNHFLPRFIGNMNDNLPESYKTVWMVIRGYFIQSDGKINRVQMEKVIQEIPEFYIRIYPIEAHPYHWVSAVFEFWHNGMVYKIAF